MDNMFNGASSFDQNLDSWKVGDSPLNNPLVIRAGGAIASNPFVRFGGLGNTTQGNTQEHTTSKKNMFKKSGMKYKRPIWYDEFDEITDGLFGHFR